VVALPVGGSKALDTKFGLHRGPRPCKTWFPAGSILSHEAHIDAAVREWFEETCLTVTVNDLTRLSGNLVRVPLLLELGTDSYT
jgi:8-oxo-dGTP pyrophosphatase MutT (NUDIX family)